MEQLLSLFSFSPSPCLARNGRQQFSLIACALCKACLTLGSSAEPFFPMKSSMQTDYEVLREKQGWGPQTLRPESSFPGLAPRGSSEEPQSPLAAIWKHCWVLCAVTASSVLAEMEGSFLFLNFFFKKKKNKADILKMLINTCQFQVVGCLL